MPSAMAETFCLLLLSVPHTPIPSVCSPNLIVDYEKLTTVRRYLIDIENERREQKIIHSKMI